MNQPKGARAFLAEYRSFEFANQIRGEWIMRVLNAFIAADDRIAALEADVQEKP